MNSDQSAHNKITHRPSDTIKNDFLTTQLKQTVDTQKNRLKETVILSTKSSTTHVVCAYFAASSWINPF